jgi:pyridoxal phosphate enzyme (YggS family)
MIGHLQRNKVKYIAGYVAMVHSVDSARLAQEIEKEAARHDRVIPVLIEVNVAGEDTKFGVSPQELPELCAFIRTLPHVRLCGLMTSAPLTDNPEEDRPVFRKMSQLSVDMNSENDNNKMNGILSMGMSGDFEIAVEEGSNCVRIGTTIFGARQYT